MTYLVKKKNPRVAHLWKPLDADTVCTMYATSRMGSQNSHKYEVVESTDLRICQMCQVNAAKRGPEWLTSAD